MKLTFHDAWITVRRYKTAFHIVRGPGHEWIFLTKNDKLFEAWCFAFGLVSLDKLLNKFAKYVVIWER